MDNELMDAYINDVLTRLHSELEPGASIGEIESYLNQYDSEQIKGVMQGAKGHVAETVYVNNENSDGDEIFAELHEEPNHEGSDVLLHNQETGEISEVQIKATDNPSYVRSAMEEYPNIEVKATDEVAEKLRLDSIGISDQELEAEVERYFYERGVLAEEDLVFYGQSEETIIASNNVDREYDYIGNEAREEGGFAGIGYMDIDDVLNIGLTGGFIATLDYIKGKPKKQEKLIQAGVVAGLLDGGIDFGAGTFETSFDFNPLLLASVSTSLAFYAMRSENESIRNLSSKVAVGMTRVAKGIEYTSYGALAIEGVDFLTGLELGDVVGEAIDGLDVLDLADGAELVDGLATLGIGIGVSRLVKKAMKGINSKDKENIKSLHEKNMLKDLVRGLLRSDAPPNLIVGPYMSMK